LDNKSEWLTREEIHNDVLGGTLFLAYQFGHPLRVVRFVTGRGMVDVRTDDDNIEPTRFLKIELPDDLK